MGADRSACLFAVLAVVASGSAGARTSLTVWSAVSPQAVPIGGATYGSVVPTTGVLVSEQRDVDVDANGDARVAGVAATIDPTSVRLRAIGSSDSVDGARITQQRFVPGATTPDEILARHVGEPIVVATPKGEVSGILRASDAQSIVVEIGEGEHRHLEVLRREGYVLGVRLPAGAAVDKPSLAWRIATRKAGKRTFEISYRADGMAWTADYVAVLDDGARTLDFSAWATLKNATGASFDDADIVLVSGGGQVVPAISNGYAIAPRPQVAPPLRFAVPNPVRVGSGETVQVELVPARTRLKPRAIVTYEAMQDPTATPGYQQTLVAPMTDCNLWNGGGGVAGHAVASLEIDVPSALPDGRVRLFRRRGDRVELASEDALHGAAGVARITVATDNEIVGDRHATCVVDERARTLKEKVEIKLDNKGKQAADVVLREFLWRWPQWKIDPADETVRGTRAAAQTQEYRTNLPAGAKKVLAYTVVYTW